MRAITVSATQREHDLPALLDSDVPTPVPDANDVLVEVAAVSVNPVDTKLRANAPAAEDPPKILGFDAVGRIVKTGSAVKAFQVGDRVFYAGDVTRPGTNAQYHAVDARIIGKAPDSLDDGAAAALPLVTLTAWELLFDRMPFQPDQSSRGKTLLIIAGAGGVGSMAIQLGKLAGFTVIATASRAASRDWCLTLGADHVIDHHADLAPQLQALGVHAVDVALNFADTSAYWDILGELLAPQGHVGLVVEPTTELRIGDPYKAKCIGIHWEFMFARARFKTPDMARQGEILNQLSAWIDDGKIRSIQTQNMRPINAAILSQAHAFVASGQSIGKTTLSWQ